MRTVRLKSSGFQDNAGKRCPFDQLGLTSLDDAIVWQGPIDGNTINPFIKGLKSWADVEVIPTLDGVDLAPYITKFIRCNLVEWIDVTHVEVRIEFRKTKTDTDSQA